MSTPASHNNVGDEAQQHGTHTFNFCSECSNMLYPEENAETRELYYKCRTCNYSELAASLRVMHNELNTSAGETAGVTQDVGSDPTVSEEKSPFVSISCLDFIRPAPEENLTTEAAVFKDWAKNNLHYEINIQDPVETPAVLDQWKGAEKPPTPDSASDRASSVRQIAFDSHKADHVFPKSTPPTSPPSSAYYADDEAMEDAEDEEEEEDEDDVTDDEEYAMIKDPTVMLFGYRTRSGRRIFKCRGRDGLYREMMSSIPPPRWGILGHFLLAITFRIMTTTPRILHYDTPGSTLISFCHAIDTGIIEERYPCQTSLPRSNKVCPACRHTESVFFQSQERKADTGMKLFYVCCDCGHIFD